MKRKILHNLLIGLFIPFILKIRYWQNLIDAIRFNKYVYYDFHFDSLSDFLKEVLFKDYFIIYLFSIFLILLPFQFIKDSYNKWYERTMRIWQKYSVLLAIILFWFILFFRGPITDNQTRLNLVIGILIFTGILCISLHFLIDRHEEKLKIQ